MTGRYDHLCLTEWPFRMVPERALCTFLADRIRLQADVSGLLAALARKDTSDIHLFWAWFGAGKTHTLFYLANRADLIGNKQTNNALHTVYSEFPKTARGFLDLYRSFLAGIDIDKLVDAFLEVSTSEAGLRAHEEMALALPDLVAALQLVATGTRAERLTAIRWLRAENLPITTFRRIGVWTKIAGVEDATRILATLIQMFHAAAVSEGRPGCNVVWLIDEFQRVSRSGSRALNEINAGLHSTFNACPTGLSLFLSFSDKPQSALPAWFSPELRDRIGRTKVLLLPPMLRDEALIFIRDILAQYRTSTCTHSSPYHPFSEESCEVIIQELDKKEELKPRSIMRACDAVLEEADRLIEEGHFEVVSKDFARKVLAEYTVLEGVEE